MFQRPYIQIISNRIEEPVKLIQVIAGARQVGKTTMVKQALEQCKFPYKYVSADAVPASDQSWLDGIWNEVRLMQHTTQKTCVLAIDEIQKIYQWSEKIKQLWDDDRMNDRQIHLIILGSSRLLLQQGLTESLSGRFELVHLPHWTFAEMRDGFGVSAEEYAWYGAYPGAATLTHDEDRWKQYIRESLIETAISKDLLMLTRIDKPALLRSLFEVGASYSGQILSYNKLMGQLQDAGNTTTLAHYLKLLDGAGLLTGISKFAGDVARKKSSSPRLQVFNNATMNCYRIENYEVAKNNPAIWGRVVESAIGCHFLAFRDEGIEIAYYREGDVEVDYILSYKGKYIAIEIKTTRQEAKGLSLFLSKFSPHRSYVISPDGISWQELLTIHPKQLFD
jgi:predicted AAA+ superfamily ATPase